MSLREQRLSRRSICNEPAGFPARINRAQDHVMCPRRIMAILRSANVTSYLSRGSPPQRGCSEQPRRTRCADQGDDRCWKVRTADPTGYGLGPQHGTRRPRHHRSSRKHCLRPRRRVSGLLRDLSPHSTLRHVRRGFQRGDRRLDRAPRVDHSRQPDGVAGVSFAHSARFNVHDPHLATNDRYVTRAQCRPGLYPARSQLSDLLRPPTARTRVRGVR